MRLVRALRHLLTPPWASRWRFDAGVVARIEAAIAETEALHAGEIRFAVESALDLGSLWRGVSARDRALEAFAELRVWDTADNNGVLVFVLLADRDVEIVADRGISSRVPPVEWESICRAMEEHLRAGRFAEGAVAGVRGVGDLLARHFPRPGGDANELPNRPVIR
jgi:uncharacterized membrane protein